MSAFDYLSGSVKIKAAAPENWKGEHTLPFWQDPNNDAWGRLLCRVLYHETIHFWQFLSSGYIANLVAGDWKRLLHYETTGELLPESSHLQQFVTAQGDIPFSNRELVETWARYWDVHTRSPVRIMEEENIHPETTAQWEIAMPGSTATTLSYTNNAFDLVLQTGPDCKSYGRPYRWLLEQFQQHSAFVGLLFPLITHAAFGCPQPSLLFCTAYNRAWQSKAIKKALEKRTGSINLDWFKLWQVVLPEAILPALQEQQYPAYTSGLDVIARGPLQTHPVFSAYLYKVHIKGYLALYKPQPRGKGEYDLQEAQALQEAPLALDPLIPFALPGQPFYRMMLGNLVPPPCIRFENFTWWAPRPVQLKLQAAQKGIAFEDSFATLSNDLEYRVSRLRNAEKAVTLGLKANAFEKASSFS